MTTIFLNRINTTIIPSGKIRVEGLIKILILYFFIFQPPFISRASYFLIEFIILLLVLLINPKIFLHPFKYFLSEAFLFLVIIMYSLLRDIIAGDEVFFLRNLSWAFQCFFFSIIIISFSANRDYSPSSLNKVFSYAFWTIIIAGFFSVILLANPAINDFYRSLIIIDPYEVEQFAAYRIRGFGIGESLTFTYPYLLGFALGYLFFISNKKPLFLVFIPFLALGIFFNARIGFIPIILFLLILLLNKDGFKKISLISISAFFILLFLPLFPIYELISQNMDWVLSLFFGFSDLFEGNTSKGTLGILFSEALIFPQDTISWIFGQGINLFFPPPGYKNSDIGYINQLNYGGLIFMSLLVMQFIFMAIRLYKKVGIFNWVFITFTLSILFLNFKGSAFSSTPGTRFLYLIYVWAILLTIKSKELVSDK